VASAKGAPESPPPADHLAPDELAEGATAALGIRLPQVLTIQEFHGYMVRARGPVTVHALVGYLSGRLQGGVLREGRDAATFQHVNARDFPGRELLVTIRQVPGGTSLEIREVLHPPAPDLPDEAARWRQVGLRPDGKLLDPTHLD
jgi:hypothetical protein